MLFKSWILFSISELSTFNLAHFKQCLSEFNGEYAHTAPSSGAFLQITLSLSRTLGKEGYLGWCNYGGIPCSHVRLGVRKCSLFGEDHHQCGEENVAFAVWRFTFLWKAERWNLDKWWQRQHRSRESWKDEARLVEHKCKIEQGTLSPLSKRRGAYK